MLGWETPTVKQILIGCVKAIGNIISSMLCRHIYVFKRNIHGDEINYLNGRRSEYICLKCDRHQLRDKLFESALK